MNNSREVSTPNLLDSKRYFWAFLCELRGIAVFVCPDELPVRSEVEVLAPEPRDDATYGVMGRLISFVTGAAQEDGFGGLAGGHGGRRNLLRYDAFEPDSAAPTFRFRRTDTGQTVEVTYHVSEVPDGGPALGTLQQIIDGTASEEERDLVAAAWHGRVKNVLSDDSLFSVTTVGR